ncbi:hypothetical protein SSCG_05476 [Streptomyces clavuligerus]|nr:hypothetical protein SSCG_05476 [Streptomyces clavuligerus]
MTAALGLADTDHRLPGGAAVRGAPGRTARPRGPRAAPLPRRTPAERDGPDGAPGPVATTAGHVTPRHGAAQAATEAGAPRATDPFARSHPYNFSQLRAGTHPLGK